MDSSGWNKHCVPDMKNKTSIIIFRYIKTLAGPKAIDLCSEQQTIPGERSAENDQLGPGWIWGIFFSALCVGAEGLAKASEPEFHLRLSLSSHTHTISWIHSLTSPLLAVLIHSDRFFMFTKWLLPTLPFFLLMHAERVGKIVFRPDWWPDPESTRKTKMI